VSLGEGWQSELCLVRDQDGLLSVQKTYGIDKQWRRSHATDALVAMRSYRAWLEKNTITTAQSTTERLIKTPQGWLLSIVQPYLGADCQMKILSWQRKNQFEQARIVFVNLLRVVCHVGVKPYPPMFRCEIKPRDFCLDGNDNLILVDTFPPVLANRHNRIVIAHRQLNKCCIADRERQEVLEITGSVCGLLRNLCEHMMSIYPRASKQWREETLRLASGIGPDLASLLEARLSSKATKDKIQLLCSRLRTRNLQ
jgi:hypothetical protein